MREGPDIARLAALIGDPARANMLLALLAIPALTAGELAREAGVSAQTASGHLKSLQTEGLVVARPSGRHRYFTLASEPVAAMLETLLGTAASLGFVRFRPGPRDAAQRKARTCYDHLAGEIAVEIFARMHEGKLLAWEGEVLRLTAVGTTALQALGLPASALFEGSRPVCRSCLDWSERRPHLAGAAGAALLDYFVESHWVVRSGRWLRVTDRGEAGFRGLFAAPAP